MRWLKQIWDALKPEPYFHLAVLMELEGYSDFEIECMIKCLKAKDNYV